MDNMDTMKSGRVLVTSGPTRAWFDKVRHIANTSSGALGARIVEALTVAGYTTTHLFGAGSVQPLSAVPGLFESIETSTVEDVITAARGILARGDVKAIVHAMAVLDYAPEARLGEKKKSGDDIWDVRLVRTPKIIALMREAAPEAFFVGFKLESGVAEAELVARAKILLDRHRLDAVVANDLDRIGDGRHEALIVGPGGDILARPQTKESIAVEIVRLIRENTPPSG